MKVADFDFDLPADLIAQEPAAARDASRLLVLDRRTGAMVHRGFSDLPDELRKGDLLVLNDTKVLPARLHATKSTGGRVEILLLAPGPGEDWHALLNGSKSIRPGAPLVVSQDLTVVPIARDGDAWCVRLVHPEGDLVAALEAAGEVPLPPYIRRSVGDPRGPMDRQRYQTIYARVPGAVAAPTAGLHFTPALMATLAARGVETAFVTLHVGLGTFRPVRAADVGDHRMHPEAFVIPDATADAILRARKRGGRIVAVGTTVVRALESRADESATVAPGSGTSELFVYPGFRFRVVDALVTNFHLPRSTLLMLVCAFAGTQSVLSAYGTAVRERYRFYSYGDAMFLKPS